PSPTEPLHDASDPSSAPCLFPLSRCGHHRHLRSFPTRRSSDLYEAVKGLRTRLGDEAFSFSLTPDKPTAQLRQLYGALTQDLDRSEEHTSELQSREKLVCRLLPEKKNACTTSTVPARQDGSLGS